MPGGYYGEQIIEDIRSKADIVALVSEYVKLRKAGKSYVGLCPFHEEKTPSFSVDPDKQLFYCFGCGEGGNVFSFLMKKNGMTFPEAVQLLADRVGVRLPSPKARPEEEAARKHSRRLRAALDFAQKKYQETLFSSEGAAALKYLEGRGLTRDTMDRFGLGYAPDEWEFISSAGRAAGLDQEDIAEAGLLVARERPASGYYDRFRHRVTFPIWDSGGDLIGFGGRTLGNDQAKYLNSPDTPLFRKGKELYALNLAKPSIRRQGTVCIVEGYMDVITCFQHGIDYAVAGMGTALSREQARTLLLLSQRVLLAYDQDEAGKRAARRSIDVVREAGGRASVVTFQGAKDPDEVLRARGKEAFAERLNEATPDIAFIYGEAVRTFGSAGVEGKVRVKEAIVPVLASLESEFERSAYVEEIARDLGVRKESLDKDVEAHRRKAREAPKYIKPENRDTTGYDNLPSPGRPSTDRPGAQAGDPASFSEVSVVRRKAEEGVIRCLIEDTGLSALARENLTEKDFADGACRDAFGALRGRPFSSIDDQGLQRWLAELCARFGPVGQPERILRDCLRKLKEIRLGELRDRIALLERQQDAQALEIVRRDYQGLLKQVKSALEFPRREDS